MSDEFLDPPPPPRHSIVLVAIALILPLVGAVGLTLAETYTQGLIIGAIVVVGSSILIFIDALLLGSTARNGKKEAPAFAMLMGMLLLWVIFYPLSFFRRSRITSPNLAFLSLLMTALFMVGPLVYSFLVPSTLPTCDNSDVKELLLKLVRGSPIGNRVTKIDGHREISFDANAPRRHCECLLHTAQSVIPLKYTIDWQDNSRTHYYVKTIPVLPQCRDKEVLSLLQQLIREQSGIAQIVRIDGHKELKYNRDKDERLGQCTAHTAKGEVPVRYTIKWNDDRKLYLVQLVQGD